MFNVVKYTWRAILPVFFLLFLSCKQTKNVAQPSDIQKAPSPELSNVEFGNLYVSGCSERAKGNLQEALKLFKKCSELEPANPAVNYELATIYKMLGQNDAALVNARAAAESEPRNEWYVLLLIDCYNATKQYSQALKARESLVRNFPEKSEFKEDLAIQYAVMGQYDKSFRIYEELEQTFGINEQLSLNKVKLLKSQKKWREVETELKKLSGADPLEPRYYAYLAEFYLEQNETEKARQMYDKILEVDPQNPTVNLALHDYYSRKGDHEQAFDYLKKAFRNPDLDPGTKAGIAGTFYSRAEEKDEKALAQGMELVKIMIGVHPTTTEANALYADFLRLEKKNTEAQIYYYRAALSEKRDFRIWDNLLYIDNELGRYDSLEHHSRTAMDLFPNQPVNYLYNGVANTQLKNYQPAVESLKTGIEFVIDNKALQIQFLSALGDAYYYLRNYEESDRAFEEALKADSDNTYVLNNYAYYLSLRNTNLEKAEKYSRRSNELQPNNRNYMDTYGWILYQQKKYKDAETWLSGAAKLAPKNPVILEHLGDVLFQLGRPAEAFKQWEAAKNAGGRSEELERKLKDKKLN